jgi:hypothetical protein
MAQVVVVTSGKGGVGKTTSTAAMGAALAHFGEKVAVIDFDVGLRNLDLVMGAERRVVFDLINVINGVAKLSQALIRDKRLENLFLLPASQTRDKDALTEEGVGKVIEELKTKFDWIICDSPAGIERGATLAMRRSSSPIRKFPRCATPIVLSGSWTQKRSRRSAASVSRSISSSPAIMQAARRAAKCSRSTMSSRSCRHRCSALFRRAKRYCAPRTSDRR